MAVSLKVVLREARHRKGFGKPVVIRITKDRKKRYIFTGIYLEDKFWDKENRIVKKSHPNYLSINTMLSSKVKELNDIIYLAESTNKTYSALEVKNKLKNKSKSYSFFEFYYEFIESAVKRKNYRESFREQSKFKNFKSFLKGRDIPFSEITVSLLNQFINYLEYERNLSKRTITNHLMTVRTLYNKAIYEGVITRENYPFGRNKISIKKYDSMKIGLDESEIKAIENLEYEKGSLSYLTKNVFLISFYFAGMRISDVIQLKWNDFVGDRLIYRMAKNDKIVSISVPAKAKAILDIYHRKNQTAGYVFPMLKKVKSNDERDKQRKINSYINIFNQYLKRIASQIGTPKNISCHISRHSFGNIAGDKIPIPLLQKLYRHSNMSTTAIYQQNFINKDTDKALDSVLDF